MFSITVFNFHNFYRTINEKNTYQFYLLLISYDLLSLLFTVFVFLCILASSFNTSSVRKKIIIDILKNKLELVSITIKAKKMGVLVHKIIARTHNQQFILKVNAGV